MTDTPELDASEGYLVEWAITISPGEADNPLEAARAALRIMRDALNRQLNFEVTDHAEDRKFAINLADGGRIVLIEEDDRCDYCHKRLPDCDFGGLRHPVDIADNREAAGLCPHGWPLTGSCAGCGRGDAQPG